MNDALPDFVAVAAFVRVAEAGSFRAAAASLAAPPSTISVQVSRLEERLGVKLFDRSTRRVALTDEGRRYFDGVRAAVEAVAEADRTLTAPAARLRGTLRVAAPVELGRALLGTVLAKYAREAPEVECQVELADADVDPVRDGFDIVLRVDPSDTTTLVARKLGVPTRSRLFASPAYLAARGVPRHPRELAQHACLVVGTRGAATTWRFGGKASGFVLVHRRPVANDWRVVCDLTVQGCGIARLPDYLGLPEQAKGRLTPVLEAFAPPPEQLHAVYARARHVPPRVQRVVEVLGAHPSPPLLSLSSRARHHAVAPPGATAMPHARHVARTKRLRTTHWTHRHARC
jgi:DNA-binding transcriptional LysR family regulator